MILLSETSGRVLRLRVERHLNPLDLITLGILELNGSLPELGFIDDFEYQRVQTRAENDAWHRLLNLNLAVREGGFVNLLPIQIYFGFILTADQHLEPALFFFRLDVANRVGHATRGHLPQNRVKVDHGELQVRNRPL